MVFYPLLGGPRGLGILYFTSYSLQGSKWPSQKLAEMCDFDEKYSSK